MKAVSKITIVSIISWIFIIFLPMTTFAGVDLPWETSFDCPEWVEGSLNDWYSIGCPGIEIGKSGEFIGTQITTDANDTANSQTSRGMRFWKKSGTNQDSTIARINFNTYQKEFWVRWYMRYEAGFSWSSLNYDKLIYLYTSPGSGGTASGGVAVSSMSEISLWSNLPSASWKGNVGFQDIWGGGTTTSDGSWHYVEAYFKMDTDGTDGQGKLWVDGILLVSEDTISWSGGNSTIQSQGWTGFMFDHNQGYPGNPLMYVDWDDMAIRNDGYIGPVGGSGATPVPTTVNMSSPAAGQTLSGTVSVSADVSGDVSGVQFKVNGENIGAEDASFPYSVIWDTSIIPDASYTLTAVARDPEGKLITSGAINVIVSSVSGVDPPTEIKLFEEAFDDTNFASRGWYDNTNLTISTSEHISGSLGSVEFRFTEGGTAPISGPAIRKKFTETDSIYVSYYVKYSANWEGSNRTYHPHEFQILTNLDGDWTGAAYAYLTAYIEQNEGVPLLAIQDGKNIDEARIGLDLTGTTEQRAVAGCNGDSDGYGDGSCYSMGTVHWNGKSWRADQAYFQDSPGVYYKNDWHFVEAYFKLNSIVSGIGVADGVIKYWYDGKLIIDHSNTMLRTGENSGMKFNQFIIGPWIGDGSPVDQTFWIDNLSVGTYRPALDAIPPAPFNLRVE